jgi:hypothetical protein
MEWVKDNFYWFEVYSSSKNETILKTLAVGYTIKKLKKLKNFYSILQEIDYCCVKYL